MKDSILQLRENSGVSSVLTGCNQGKMMGRKDTRVGVQLCLKLAGRPTVSKSGKASFPHLQVFYWTKLS